MDKYNYNVQSYFKNLCKSYYLAYEQFKRFENDKQSNDYMFWRARVNACQNEIKMVIEEMAMNKILIVISTKEEVFTIIWFLSKYVHSAYENLKYDFVNIGKDAKAAYPMDDIICEDFWYLYRACEYKENMFSQLLSRWEERWK